MRLVNRTWGLVALVLLLHVGLANRANWDKGSMFDESALIGNGLSFWATGDYRMYPIGISQNRWMTLPLYWGGYKIPAPEGEVWRLADEWGYGIDLLFRSGNDSQEMLHKARLMTSVLSAVLGLLVFVWAQELFGLAGGFVSLLLYAFNPTVLAHGSAATLDLAAALAFTAALWTLWRLLHRITPRRLVLSGLVWGLALTAKFSTLLLVPMALVLVAVRLAGGRPWTVQIGSRRTEVTARGGMVPYVALIAAAHVAVACLVIWLMFGFRFEMHRRLAGGSLDPAAVAFSDWLPNAGGYAPIIDFLHRWRVLPEGYLFSFCETMRAVVERNTFLNGRFGTSGFPSFFPYCLFYKTPLAVFLVGAAAIAACVMGVLQRGSGSGRRMLEIFAQGFYTTAPLWCLVVVYGYTAITGHINIGIRHILPVFPAAFILIGAAGRWLQPLAPSATGPFDEPQWRTAAADVPSGGDPRSQPASRLRTGGAWFVAICLAWSVADAAAAYPNYLAYFNSIGGGSKNGYRHLVDSSFDWGQELPSLKAWLDVLNVSPDPPANVYLSYFGSTPPSAYGIRATLLPSYLDLSVLEPGLKQPFQPQLSAGVYIISATMLQSVYDPVAPGPWRKDYEQAYQRLTQQLNAFFQADERHRQLLIDRDGPERWANNFFDYESLRFARLCAFLRRREPETAINHGLLVYKVTQEDLRAALSGPPVEAYDPPATPAGNVPY